jgi:hypothetical protein
VLDHWAQTVLSLCAHRADVGAHLDATLKADSGFLPALCVRGFALLFRGQNALRPDALEFAERAREEARRRGATSREQLLIDALTHWSKDDLRGARSSLEAMTASCPTDLFALKLLHGLLFLVGEPAGMRRSLEDAHPAWAGGDVPGHGYFLGCLAFALGETGDLHDSEARGREAVDVEPSDAWGVHAVAHVMETTDRVHDGAAWLDAHQESFADCSVFRGHVYWHQALFLCELGRYEEALALYDTEVNRPWCGDYRDMSNASSLLWRMETDGVNVGTRWETLAAIAVEHCRDHGSAFADAHYLLALARGSQHGARELLGSLVAYTERGGEGDQFATVRDRGLPLCRAIWASERRQCSAEELTVLSRDMLPLGGSTAQRDLFTLYAIDAAIRSGDNARAERALYARLKARPDNRWARARIGEPEDLAHLSK